MAGTNASPLASVTDYYAATYARRSADELALIAQVKRFTERWSGDAAWRSALAASPDSAASLFMAAGLSIDPAQLACKWHPDADAHEPGLAWQVWTDWAADLRTLRDLLRRAASTAATFPEFERWRQRQARRMAHELDPITFEAIPNVIAAYELAQGCSVGCWFCGVAAEGFRGSVVHNAQTAALWRGMLGAMVSRFGDAAATGFCYWASDPSDTPDYAAFAEDHRRITGWRPQITTARPFASAALLAELLDTPKEHRHANDRISVLTKRVLDRLHAEFDCMALLHVDLVMQLKGAVMRKAKSGRGRRRERDDDGAPFEQGSIACVSGFLVNLPERSVRMVSPCRATDQWENGYRIFGERRFDDAAGFGAAIDSLVADNVSDGPHPASPLGINESMKLAFDAQGLVIRTGAHEGRVGNFRFLPRLIEMLRAANHTETELIRTVGAEYPDDLIAVPAVIRDLFENGVLDEAYARRADHASVHHV